MNRRALLAGLGGAAAALAGCTAPGVGGRGPTTAPSPVATEFPAVEIPNPTVERNAYRVETEVVAEFSVERPAAVEIRLTNRGEHRRYSFGGSPPYSDYWGERDGGDAGLLLVPADRTYVDVLAPDRFDNVTARPGEEPYLRPPEPVDGCWRANGKLLRNDIALERDLAPGETVAERYDLVAGVENEGCLPAGRYEFGGRSYLDDGDWALSLELG